MSELISARMMRLVFFPIFFSFTSTTPTDSTTRFSSAFAVILNSYANALQVAVDVHELAEAAVQPLQLRRGHGGVVLVLVSLHHYYN